MRGSLGLVATSIVGLTLTLTGTAHATPYPGPPDPPPSPVREPPVYPTNIGYYTKLDPEMFRVSGEDGIWFRAPTGQNCGIFRRGSFGCAGNLPGQPGTTHIGWIDGDRTVHSDWSVSVRFPGTRAIQTLPALSAVKYEGTVCAATVDNKTYCERGPFQFMITPDDLWLTPL